MTTAVRQDTGRVLAVVLDRVHARFFDVSDAGAVELPSLESSALRGGRFHSDRQGSPGWGEREHHGRVREEARRYLATVVERLVRLDRERSGVSLLVAGLPASIAALWRALPPALTDRLIGTTRLNPSEATPATVARAARHACETREPAAEHDLVDALEEGLGRGRATIGAHETLRALAQGQVQTLLVAADVHATGFRCAHSQRLVLSAADCLEEGDPIAVPNLIGEAIAAARGQRATVITIRDPDALRRIDGLAALLRFP